LIGVVRRAAVLALGSIGGEQAKTDEPKDSRWQAAFQLVEPSPDTPTPPLVVDMPTTP